MQVEIDGNSGFCAGVINAIRTAEEWLGQDGHLYCLGDIVHNSEEMQRLSRMGLEVISHDQFRQLRNARVLIRAHGEPPETYRIAKENNIEIIDATCKVVLHLQQTIKEQYEQCGKETQILIFGKRGHAEVVGLVGQTAGHGLVLSSPADAANIDYSRPSHLFSQTTQNPEEYQQLIDIIREEYARRGTPGLFSYSDTICHSVVNRARQIGEFARHFGKIIFVSGEKSSNGLYLYNICKDNNPHTHLITDMAQLSQIHFDAADTVGICGATSTPMWLMQSVKQQILNP